MRTRVWRKGGGGRGGGEEGGGVGGDGGVEEGVWSWSNGGPSADGEDGVASRAR